MLRSLALIVPTLVAGLLLARPDPVNPDPNTPRPIEGVDTVWVEEMTWMEVPCRRETSTRQPST